MNSLVRAATLEFQRAAACAADRCPDAALRHLARAEELGYDPNACAASRWHCWMKLGEFEQAWRESDRISRRSVPDSNSLWDGLPFDGRRVIIRCLHGYGDAIQFLRYADMVRRTASRVIVETHPEMVSVLRGIAGPDAVVTWAMGCKEPFDQQIEAMELPRAFRTTLSTIPDSVPYLEVSALARERSRKLLGESAKPKVGILWGSSVWNPARSIEFGLLWPLLSLDCCSFYSFQRGQERVALAFGLPAGCKVHDTALHSPDIADTAADLMNMDLLITVDTMAAHLAGALGRKVWVMLPWDADWRWMLDREDSPWYPTMRLFRQPSPGTWDPVICRIARNLQQLFS